MGHKQGKKKGEIMGTRSLVGIYQKGGNILFIYVHYDGYLEGVGKTLLKFYTTEESVIKLMGFGFCSSLDMETGEPKDSHGEPAMLVSYSKFFRQDYDQEYYYLFTAGKWEVSFRNPRPLEDFIKLNND